MNLNYTCICFYCGEIYQSNRSTSRYCCSNHNSLCALNGTMINNTIINQEGQYKDYFMVFMEMFFQGTDKADWDGPYTYDTLVNEFGYDGPLPNGNELLLISSFLFRKLNSKEKENDTYYIKPYYLLTKHEKATCNILKGGYYFIEDQAK